MENANTKIDQLVASATAFATLEEMCTASGNYRPSLNMRRKDHRIIADAYDQRQAERGDSRLAFRC